MTEKKLYLGKAGNTKIEEEKIEIWKKKEEKKANRKFGVEYIIIFWLIQLEFHLSTSIIIMIIKKITFISGRRFSKGLYQTGITITIIKIIFVEINQNIDEGPGDLGRLAVTQTPVEDHQLMLVWKTHKGDKTG